jgi:phosphoribosylaminoimidazolecarboxamide formyltransferase/IMP cyclohydrolase
MASDASISPLVSKCSNARRVLLEALPMSNVPIKRALISVSDKAGIVDFAKKLAGFGCELLSTGGTAKALRDAGLKVLDVSEYTGFPEMMDGRVKTLHPKVHGGLLARRDLKEHQEAAKKHGIGMIDMVIVNLYPFEATVAKEGVTRDHAIENIDIGGPSMVRSAAKNHEAVAVVTDPADYDPLAKELDASKGALGLDTRKKLARKAFRMTSWYDHAIAEWLCENDNAVDPFTPQRLVALAEGEKLRYGENPHQEAAFYRTGRVAQGLGNMEKVAGKELSYNNLLDLDAALRVSSEFDSEAFAVIIKHTNPCGAAAGASIAEAFTRAYACDPVSAFGGIVGLNRPFDKATAEAMLEGEKFIEALVAPSFEQAAVDALLNSNKKWRKSIRLIKARAVPVTPNPIEYRAVSGGMLVQHLDVRRVQPSQMKVVTEKLPDDRQMEELFYAWTFCKHFKSNAIVVAKAKALLGYGAGQTNRVDSTKHALERAGEKARGAVLASDAFFPFADSISLAAAAGIGAIIQPGGSVRDEDVIAACNKSGIAMVFTGMRHFRH